MSKRTARFNLSKHRQKEAILRQAKKEGNIVYGGEAIRRRLGINARRTLDIDAFSKTPRASAVTSDKNLDKITRSNDFFVKKGFNVTTYKVKWKGADGRKGTKDDVGVVDYTKTTVPTPKTFTSGGVKYRTLQEELKAKQRLVRSKEFEFRREKDLADLNKIKRFGKRYL